MQDALQGVKVVEFGAYAAGPCIGKYLANFGAEVIHVESKQRPDGFRLQYPPFKDGKIGINRSGCFSFFNDSKYGITLDLKHRKGMDLAYRLVEWADIVIENMRPGVMRRIGLGWETLKEHNPKLVMLSTSNMGQWGPYASHPGFGSQLSSLSGFTHLIGEPNGPPYFLYGPYIDFIAVAFGGVSVLAGLDHVRRTGEGVFIDLAQYEGGLQFIAGALLDYSANGTVAVRDGNREPDAAPHGCFPCKDGQWCVVSCWDDAEWSRFCAASGISGLADDLRFATLESRKQREFELNAEITEWTKQKDAEEAMRLLQNNRVHAAVVKGIQDLFSDPQLALRNVWQQMQHPEIGNQKYRMVSYALSATPGRIRTAAPCLGEHNEEVFQNILGLQPKEYQELSEQGVFS